MANTLSTVKNAGNVVAKEAAMILHDNLQFLKLIDREKDDYFRKKYEGAKPGDTIDIRTPTKFTTRSGATYSAQNVVESHTALTVATQKGIDFEFTSAEFATDIDKYSERVIQPAIKQLTSAIESDVLSGIYDDVWNVVGTAGTAPNSLDVYLAAGEKLSHNLAPLDRKVLINASAARGSVDALKGLFQSSDEISKQYKDGMMGRTAGFDFYQNELVPTHTNGTQGGTPLVNDATWVDASSVAIDGVTSGGTWTAGTVFTMAGVNAVHPETKADLGVLQQFVVTADVTFTNGTGTVAVLPAITATSGALQTVSSGPADDAVVTLSTGATASQVNPQNLAFCPSFARFCMLDLPLAGGIDHAGRESEDGISIRFHADYDIDADKFQARFDVLYGYATVRPEHACRITG